MAKPALGRGLGALLGGNAPVVAPAAAPANIVSPAPTAAPVAPVAAPVVDNRERVTKVPLAQIRPCSFQPRKDFPPESLRELADSIREQGIIQPLIVRKVGDHLELIAGERRWRASQLLNLAEVPVIVREADDRAVLELALIENLQRENLNPIEEAAGYAQLIEQFSLKQEEVGVKVGKSRTVVANALRLLKLPASVQGYVRDGRLSVGHAKVILGLVTEKDQKAAAERVLKEGFNVRQTEQLVAKLNNRATGVVTSPTKAPLVVTDTHVADLESKLRETFGTKVQMRYAAGKGSVEISFYSDAELERVLKLLGINPD
jgi:ParB family chromosome partitioning protein